MDEHTIHWNAASEEWLCVRCLRSSDHITREDAAHELKQFDCLSYGSPGPKALIEERRGTARTKTSLQAEIVLRGRTVPMRASTTDLSLGGCYVENMFTLNIGAHLTMTLWIGEQKLNVKGIVKTLDPVFGNGIQFIEMEPTDRTKLESYLNGAIDS